MTEADERFPAGPQGETGERGERGLSRLQGRAIVVLFAVAVLVGGFGLFWSAHQVSQNNQKWCSLMVTLTRADASARKPPAPGTFTAQFTDEITGLSKSLGC